MKTVILCDIISCPDRKPSKLRGTLALIDSFQKAQFKTMGATTQKLLAPIKGIAEISPHLQSAASFVEAFLLSHHKVAVIDMPESTTGTEPVLFRKRFQKKAKIIEVITINEKDTPQQIDALTQWCLQAPIKNFCLVIEAPLQTWREEWDPLAYLIAGGNVLRINPEETLPTPAKPTTPKENHTKPLVTLSPIPIPTPHTPTKTTPKKWEEEERSGMEKTQNEGTETEDTPSEPQKFHIHDSIAHSNLSDVVGVMNRNHYLFYTGLGQSLASQQNYTGCSLRNADLPYPESYKFRKPIADQDTPINHLERAINRHVRQVAQTNIRATVILQEEDNRILANITANWGYPKHFDALLIRNALRTLQLPIEKDDITIDITDYIPMLSHQLEVDVQTFQPR